MSIEAIKWVLTEAPLPLEGHDGVAAPVLTLTLLGLANHANPDGSLAFPAKKKIAEYARISERQVQRALSALVDLGVISPTQYPASVADKIKRADRRPNGYDLHVWLQRGDATSPRNESTGRHDDTHGETRETERGDNGVSRTILNHPDPSSEKSADEKNDREDVEEICAALCSMMVENGCRRPTITPQWRTQARLMFDKDKRPFNEALSILTWSLNDEFWRGNVKSIPKFREQYDQLRLKSEGKRQQIAAAPDVMDWLRQQWSTANAKAVGDRSGIHPPQFDPPGHLETGDQINDWYKKAKRDWISANTERCREAILAREGGSRAAS